MRVISGSARGRKLKTPAGSEVRPTSDRVKESVFDIIQFDIEGRRALDLFAGTGQLGIEALSRGAAAVSFVDNDAQCIKLIRENLKSAVPEGNASVYNTDALRYLDNDETFDIIFIDPPYDTPLANKAVSKIIEFDKLRKNGIIICEMSAAGTMPQVKAPYVTAKTYRYGQTILLKIIRN